MKWKFWEKWFVKKTSKEALDKLAKDFNFGGYDEPVFVQKLEGTLPVTAATVFSFAELEEPVMSEKPTLSEKHRVKDFQEKHECEYIPAEWYYDAARTNTHQKLKKVICKFCLQVKDLGQ